jgi:hypothetical protein
MKRDPNDKARKKTLYFDYENEWRVKTSSSADFQVEDNKYLENELKIPSEEEQSETLASNILEPPRITM